MLRYLSTLIFLTAGTTVLVYNATQTARVLTFPLIDRIWPAAAGDLHLQGRISGVGLVLLGVLALANAVRGHLRERSE